MAEVYLNDMIVKSKVDTDHMANLLEVFLEAWKNNLLGFMLKVFGDYFAERFAMYRLGYEACLARENW